MLSRRSRLTRTLQRLRFARLSQQTSAPWLPALFVFINGCLAIGIMAGVALLSDEPFIFPSLGPTAFLFFYVPLAPVACPRNAILGHLTGVLAGWLSLAIFGLRHAGPALQSHVTTSRVAAAALSLGLTGGLMLLLRAPHPPAGATTLIVSLGILHSLEHLAVLMAAVLLLTLQALAINRLSGLPYPLWSPATQPTPGSPGSP